eukprot:RCo017175
MARAPPEHGDARTQGRRLRCAGHPLRRPGNGHPSVKSLAPWVLPKMLQFSNQLRENLIPKPKLARELVDFLAHRGVLRRSPRRHRRVTRRLPTDPLPAGAKPKPQGAQKLPHGLELGWGEVDTLLCSLRQKGVPANFPQADQGPLGVRGVGQYPIHPSRCAVAEYLQDAQPGIGGGQTHVEVLVHPSRSQDGRLNGVLQICGSPEKQVRDVPHVLQKGVGALLIPAVVVALPDPQGYVHLIDPQHAKDLRHQEGSQARAPRRLRRFPDTSLVKGRSGNQILGEHLSRNHRRLRAQQGKSAQPAKPYQRFAFACAGGPKKQQAMAAGLRPRGLQGCKHLPNKLLQGGVRDILEDLVQRLVDPLHPEPLQRLPNAVVKQPLNIEHPATNRGVVVLQSSIVRLGLPRWPVRVHSHLHKPDVLPINPPRLALHNARRWRYLNLYQPH